MAACTRKTTNLWYTSNCNHYLTLLYDALIGRFRVTQEYINVDLSDETTSIAYLVPKTTGQGCCTTALVDHLVMIHNEFIDICIRTIKEMHTTGRTW